MSDLSIIAHDYALNAEFARRLNEAVLALKRFYLVQRVGRERDLDVATAREDLRGLLEAMISAIKDDSQVSAVDQAQVPADVVEAFRKKIKGDLPEMLVELRRVTFDLANRNPIDDPAFRALDIICEAADATASAAFRRLRRI